MENFTLERPAAVGAPIDEAAIHAYFRAVRDTLPLVQDNAVKPSERRMKALPGYSMENFDGRAHSDAFTLGTARVRVETTPTTLRPEYKGVVQELETLLEHVVQGEANPRFVRVEDGQHFYSVRGLRSHINETTARLKRGSAGFRQSVTIEHKFRNGDLDVGAVTLPTVPLPDDPAAHPMSEAEVRAYLQGEAFAAYVKEQVVQPVQEFLEKGTGYNKRNPPAEHTVTTFQFGNHVVNMAATPRSSVSYGAVINSLVKETKRPGKSTGDLVLLAEAPESLHGRRAARQLGARTLGGEQYVAVGRVQQLLEERLAAETRIETRFSPSIYCLG